MITIQGISAKVEKNLITYLCLRLSQQYLQDDYFLKWKGRKNGRYLIKIKNLFYIIICIVT